jgi:hypothetical protein
MICRIVRPDLVVLPLSAGDTITVKKRLSSGEERKMIRRGISYTAEGVRSFDPIDGGVSKILAYLVDWTFHGLDGTLVPIRDQPPSVVEAEVLRAIEAHEATMTAEREAEKKTQSGAPASSVISPSPAAAAGAMSGS